MRYFQKYKRIILLLVIPAVLLLLVNASLNRHNHFIEGYLYSHAHPFERESSDKPYAGHTHTNVELIALNLLGDMDLVLGIALLMAFIGLSTADSIIPLAGKRPLSPDYCRYSSRGPPDNIF